MRIPRLAILFALAGLLGWPAAALPQPSRLKLAEPLPPLAGRTLTGHALALPSAAHGEQSVLIFSFSRDGGQQEQKWVTQLTRDHAPAVIYSAIFLESVPRLFRPLALAGIRSGMPAPLQGRTLILYRDERLWLQRWNHLDKSNAGVVLLDPEGRICWITSAPFTESLGSALEKQIRASR
jgi:hypothetical protein